MKKKIILLGLDFASSNLGCSALAYSFLHILDKIANESSTFFEIISVNYNIAQLESDNYSIKTITISPKSVAFYFNIIQAVRNAEIVFDFTGGDSFTDIYGPIRFVKESLLKQIILWSGKPLVIGPQTIGPFNRKLFVLWSRYILQNSIMVFTRDQMSFDYAKLVLKCDSVLTTDIAFLLPADEKYMIWEHSDKIRIGINISGLMWNGGYNGNNDFGLLLDYHQYIKELIRKCLKNNVEVHLIAHVLPQDEKSVENDFTVNKILKEEFSQVKLSPSFVNPMQAKAYIAGMDFFIGSRMHATIGAFSMGIPTISVSYSRKFEGLYNSINYPYTIDAKAYSTDKALATTLNWIEKRSILKNDLKNSLDIIVSKNNEFIYTIKKKFFEDRV